MVGNAVSSERGGWQAFGIGTAIWKPQHLYSPFGATNTSCFVNPHTPSTTNVGDRIDVAETDELIIESFQCRPCDSGLGLSSTDGMMPVESSQPGSQL